MEDIPETERTEEERPIATRRHPNCWSTDDVRPVTSYGDLIKDSKLNVRAADAIAHELDNGSEFVAWVPKWLIDMKPIASSDHHEQVVAGGVEIETQQAYLVSSCDAESWLPKSQICVFERADGAALTITGVHDEAAGE